MGSVDGITRRTVLGGLAVGGTLALTGCGSSKTASYRFRMTVETNTPAGVKTGSSVMEESAYRETFRTSETGPGGGGIRGEAVVVDLPDGPLFALLKLPGANGQLPVTEALTGTEHFTTFEDYFAAVQKLGGWFSHAKAELPREHWPMMVRFGDVNDPKSVEQVDSAIAGVKRILLETTRDEVTIGIEKRLPWLGPLKGGYLNGSFTSRGSPLSLDGTAFSTEIR